MLKTIVSGSDFPPKNQSMGNPPFFLEHPQKMVPGLSMLHAASQRPGSGPQRQDGRATGRAKGYQGVPKLWYPNSYPLVMTNVAIENGHRNSGFSH